MNLKGGTLHTWVLLPETIAIKVKILMPGVRSHLKGVDGPEGLKIKQPMAFALSFPEELMVKL